ncbi:Eukaryotic aspartyl protease [Aphelenchoides bicaudatus]|nr:Eukaryotic aspartyl protease [Aphelenchoides bicaudatus]
MRSLALCLFVTVLALAAEASKSFVVPLTQRVMSGHEIAQMRKSQPASTGRRGMKLIQRQYKNDYLLLNTSIGIPSTIPDSGCAQFQHFQLALEVGSAWTFVLGPNYSKLDKSQVPYYANQSIASELASNSYQGKSGTYNITGNTYRDYVAVNNYIFRQHFGVANDIWTTGERKGKISFPVDGVLGLSWIQDLSVESPIKQLCSKFQDTSDTCRLILWLDTHKKPSYGTSAGKLIFDHDNTGAQYCDTSSYSSASASLNFDINDHVASFYVDSIKYGTYSSYVSRSASVNSGFSEIILPEDDYNSILNIINPDFDENTGLSVIDCDQVNSLADITFRIGGTDVTVSASQYVLDLDLSDNQCAVAFSQREDTFIPTEYTFGNAFIRAYCVEIDNDSSSLSIYFHKNKSA